MTMKELSKKLNIPITQVFVKHHLNELKKVNNALPEVVDPRLIKLMNNARTRCKTPSPRNSKYYIDRGVKFELSLEDALYLWDRDKVEQMNIPSLDRKDHLKNYNVSNCRFIEWRDNRNKKGRPKTKKGNNQHE